jgi:hypothetical protein
MVQGGTGLVVGGTGLVVGGTGLVVGGTGSVVAVMSRGFRRAGRGTAPRRRKAQKRQNHCQ